jgi:hypothetical protein
MLAQEGTAGGRHADEDALARHVEAHDEATFARLFPDGQSRARGLPGVEHVCIGPLRARDPLDEVEHQRIERVGCDLGGGRFSKLFHDDLRFDSNPST